MAGRTTRRSVGRYVAFFREVSSDLCFAVTTRVRYETPGADGETRSERNERFGHGELNPDWGIPDDAMYLWNWYYDLSRRFRRVIGGVPVPIPPTEFLAWQKLTGNVVTPMDYAILTDMDEAFCAATSEHIAAERAHQQSKAEASKGIKDTRSRLAAIRGQTGR